MKRKTRAKIAFVIAGVLAVCVIGAVAAVSYFHDRAATFEPSPALSADDTEREQAEQGFSVDWEYWQGVNPDIVAWIRIPGTEVSSPIVQAQPDDPDYYLDHDVYGSYNPYGAVYLDAGCKEMGLFGSRNAVIFGHHMNDGSMFADVADYSDWDFADTHKEILIYTPQGNRTYTVQAAEVISGNEQLKRVAFQNEADFITYYAERFDNCDMKYASDISAVEQSGHVLTLCTCSYLHWDNERTLVYAACDETIG